MSAEEETTEQGELFEHHRFDADEGQSVLRVDKFLIDRIPNTSRNKIQEAAKSGFVKVNSKVVKSNYKVKPGDEVTVELPYPVREIELIPQDIPLDVVYEDEEVIVVNKQANIVVHPGYGNYSGTLVNALVYHFQNLPVAKGNTPDRPGLVHRLDKHTTGVLVVGKTDHALMDLSRQFFDRTTERRYWALVWGDVKEDGTVIGNLGRSPKNRKLMQVFEDDEAGKHAVTHYRILEKFGYVTLVECKLETGRTHQIRAHMKHIGHPLFKDLEYGGDKILKGTTFSKYKQFIENCFKLIPGQALHAKTLGFVHPSSGEKMQFNSDLPEGFQQLLEKWRGYLAVR